VRWVLLVVALLGVGPARAEMEVYQPRHRAGEDLRPLAETALGPEGSVAVDPHTGALVLVGETAAVQQALELLALQDRRLRTVWVEHEMRSLAELEAAGHRIEWSVGGDDLRVGNVTGDRPGARITVGSERRSGEGRDASGVRVLEGEWARIAQGSEVLLPIGSHRYPDAVRVAADSGLEVRPRILGDGRVRLDLRPFRARLGPGGVVAREGAETTMVVTPGRPAVVGGIGRAGSTSAGGAGGRASASGQRDSVLVVTVTVDEDAPAD